MTNPNPNPPPIPEEAIDPTQESDPPTPQPDYQPLIFKILADLKEVCGRLDERTQTLTKETADIKTDLRGFRDGQKDLVTDKFAWRMVKVFLTFGGIIVALIAGIVYYTATHHSHQQPHLPTAIQPPAKAVPGGTSP